MKVDRVQLLCTIKTATATKVVQPYVDQAYAKSGSLHKIISDDVFEFKNHLFIKVATQLGVEHKIYSPHYIYSQM